MPRGRGENRQQQVAVASGSGQRFSQQRRPLKRCQREIQSLNRSTAFCGGVRFLGPKDSVARHWLTP